jgi:hypothetical protein
MIKIGTPIQFGQVWPNILPNFGPFDPFCHWCRLKYFDICTDSSDCFQKGTMSQSLGYLLTKLPLFWPYLAQIWPNLVHLTHFVTGVGSSILIYALTVVITFRNVIWPKVLGLYFRNWLFWADLAQIWPNLVHLKTCKGWQYVSGALRVLMTLKNMLRLKI